MKKTTRILSTGILAAVLLSLLTTPSLAEGEKARALATEKLKQVYRQVLGREATQKDIDHHIKLLENRELTPKQIRANLVKGAEGTAAINRVFKQERGSDPNAKQFARAQAALMDGASLEDLRRELRR